MCTCKEYAGGEFDERLRWVCPECEEMDRLSESDSLLEQSLTFCPCGNVKRDDCSLCEACLTDYAEEICA